MVAEDLSPEHSSAIIMLRKAQILKDITAQLNVFMWSFADDPSCAPLSVNYVGEKLLPRLIPWVAEIEEREEEKRRAKEDQENAAEINKNERKKNAHREPEEINEDDYKKIKSKHVGDFGLLLDDDEDDVMTTSTSTSVTSLQPPQALSTLGSLTLGVDSCTAAPFLATPSGCDEDDNDLSRRHDVSVQNIQNVDVSTLQEHFCSSSPQLSTSSSSSSFPFVEPKTSTQCNVVVPPLRCMGTSEQNALVDNVVSFEGNCLANCNNNNNNVVSTLAPSSSRTFATPRQSVHVAPSPTSSSEVNKSAPIPLKKKEEHSLTPLSGTPVQSDTTTPRIHPAEVAGVAGTPRPPLSPSCLSARRRLSGLQNTGGEGTTRKEVVLPLKVDLNSLTCKHSDLTSRLEEKDAKRACEENLTTQPQQATPKRPYHHTQKEVKICASVVLQDEEGTHRKSSRTTTSSSGLKKILKKTSSEKKSGWKSFFVGRSSQAQSMAVGMM